MLAMFEGKSIEGIEFYNLLYTNDEFCKEFGQAILAAGRLESVLKQYLNETVPGEDTSKATLGRLIKIAEKNPLLRKMVPVLESIRDQRNYFTHNIYALFSGLVEETILERTGLLDSDVATYMERAWMLKENLNGLADIISRHLNK